MAKAAKPATKFAKPAAKPAKATKPAAKQVAAKAAPGPKLRKEFQTERFAAGLAVRRAVLGAEYVDKSVESATDFMTDFQKMVTEFCWGDIWTRPGLVRRDRSLLNLAMLAALNRPNELKLHLKGALNNGVTRDEIKEVFMAVCVYAGVPAGLDAFKTAVEVFKEIDAA